MENEILTKPKSNKNKFIILIVVALIVVLGATGAGAYVLITNNPKVKVLKALKTNVDELKNRESTLDKITDKDFLKDLKETGIKQNMQFTLNSTDSPDLIKLNGFGINIDSISDEKNKILSIDVGTEYKGTKILDGQLYTDNKEIMLSVPKAYDAQFTCGTEHLQTQYNSSIFGAKKKLPKDEISLKVFDDEKVLEGKELLNAVLDGYLIENKTKLETLGKNIKVQKSKKTKNVEIGGVNQECVGYDIVISGVDAKDLVQSLSDYIVNNEEVKKAITKMSRKMSYTSKYDSQKRIEENIYKNLKSSIEAIDDVNASVYIDKKGRTASIELNTGITVGSKKTDVKYSSDFQGEKNISDNIKMSIELNNDEDNIKINLDNSNTTVDDNINDELNLVIAENKRPTTLKFKSQYNTKSGDFDGSVNYTKLSMESSGSFKGNAQYDKSNKTLKVDFDKCDIKAYVKYEPINISLDGSYSIAPNTDSIDEPINTKIEVFKMDQNKLLEVATAVQKNLSELAKTLKV